MTGRQIPARGKGLPTRNPFRWTCECGTEVLRPFPWDVLREVGPVGAEVAHTPSRCVPVEYIDESATSDAGEVTR